MTPDEKRRHSDEVHARQKGRNKVLGFVLVGLVVLFFVLTFVRFPTPEDRAAAAAEQDAAQNSGQPFG
ncbi:hypothetical protein [uncultured Croceicoccus sp.]|uniref:hypothetical protein n=1 Tax=uncultured Croceicoccus sp. TaxID=1295329 RepID=UPI00262EF1A6|nr:hypothetical protein [uncultured Croceicoccus sp.]